MTSARITTKEPDKTELYRRHTKLHAAMLEQTLNELIKNKNYTKLTLINCCLCSQEKPALMKHDMKLIVDTLVSLPALTEINLSHNFLRDFGARQFSLILKQMPNLQSLDLTDNDITVAGASLLIEAMSKLGDKQKLKLILGGNAINFTDGQALLRKAMDSKLVGVEIKPAEPHTSLENESLAQTLSVLNIRPVKKIVMANKNLINDDIEKLAAAIDKNQRLFIEEIDFSGNKFSDKALWNLVHVMQKCPKLRSINLGNNKINSIGASSLSEVLRSVSSLTELNLADNVISDNGAVSLAHALSEASSLKILNLAGNKIEAVGVNEIYKTAKKISALKCDLSENLALPGWDEDEVKQSPAEVKSSGLKVMIADKEPAGHAPGFFSLASSVQREDHFSPKMLAVDEGEEEDFEMVNITPKAKV